MNINDMTIGEAKKLANLFNQNSVDAPIQHVGKRCIIRCYASGVHFGTLTSRNGREVDLVNARRLWRWNTGGAGVSLSEVSQTGISAVSSKICRAVPSITLLDAIEIIPCSDVASETIEEAKVHQP